MNVAFDVGITEVHTVALSTGKLNGKIEVNVDGELVSRKRFWWWIPFRSRVEILVGDQERHVVTVDLQFARLSRKFVKPTWTAYVDGREVGVYGRSVSSAS